MEPASLKKRSQSRLRTRSRRNHEQASSQASEASSMPAVVSMPQSTSNPMFAYLNMFLSTIGFKSKSSQWNLGESSEAHLSDEAALEAVERDIAATTLKTPLPPPVPMAVMTPCPNSGTLFKYQSDLPRLPIPTLEETGATYLKSIRPLVTDEQYEKTAAAVYEFLKPGGVGEELQRRLIAHDRSKNTSWLIDWWNSYAYMAYRDPVVVYVNYFFCFVDVKKYVNKPAGRAAEIITAAMEFRRLVTSQELVPDMARKAPLCVNQYRYLFNSCRIPQRGEDVARTADPSENNHIIVMRKNQFYVLELVVDGRQLSTTEIESQIELIYFFAGDHKDLPIGAFTTQDRDSWFKLREKFISVSSKNILSLDKIETSAFVVCLDDTTPVTYEERAMSCWVGDGRNRFFDKSCEFIIFDNGVAGFNGEHSMMDATPTSRMCEFILEGLEKGKFNHGVSSGQKLDPPRKLGFDLTASVIRDVRAAEEKFDALVAQHDLKVVVFEGYGKNAIKKLGCSPDAYAQMAIQLAYYKTYGKCVATYESAQTKKYAYGRTETGRSVSVESVAWVKGMQDEFLSLEEKGNLGRKAVAAQSSYMALAADGRGVDRHLLGLRLLIKPGEKKPALFTDASFALSSHWALSTSQITSEYFLGYGWGQVVSDGYGVAYMIKEESLHFNLVSLNLHNDVFRYNFLEALREMRPAFEATIPPPKKLA